VCRTAAWREKTGVRGHRKQGMYGSILDIRTEKKREKKGYRESGCQKFKTLEVW
jgi:hypothetical protein